MEGNRYEYTIIDETVNTVIAKLYSIHSVSVFLKCYDMEYYDDNEWKFTIVRNIITTEDK